MLKRIKDLQEGDMVYAWPLIVSGDAWLPGYKWKKRGIDTMFDGFLAHAECMDFEVTEVQMEDDGLAYVVTETWGGFMAHASDFIEVEEG